MSREVLLFPDHRPADVGLKSMINITTHTWVICQEHVTTDHAGVKHGGSQVVHLLTLYILMFFFLSRTVQLLLKPLMQPRIVCEIIAGIILGPSFLGRNDFFSTRVFPETAYVFLATTAKMGMMYFSFIIGVQVDINSPHIAQKETLIIAFCSIFIPFVVCMASGSMLTGYLHGLLKAICPLGFDGVLVAMTSSISITSFAVLQPLLKELKILNSDVGRFAMSTVMITDVVFWIITWFLEVVGQAEKSWIAAVLYFVSMCGYLVLLEIAFRPFVLWVISKTPADGEEVDQCHVMTILFLVLFSGFLTDFIGGTALNGPILLGLFVPDGPPLGVTLVKRSETVIINVLMPLFFLFVGLKTDVFALTDWNGLWSLFTIFFLGYLAKFLGTLIPSIWYKMPFWDAASLSLIMSFRGQTDLFTIVMYFEAQMVMAQAFTLMVLCITLNTAIVTPLAKMLTKPRGQYTINNRRTIEHSQTDTEVRLVTCIYNQNGVPSMLHLLRATAATKGSPIAVYMLHLLDLIGRAVPMLIFHNNHGRFSKYSPSDAIVKAFKAFKASGDHIQVHSYTAVSPCNTMHIDICELALQNKASLILVPFHKQGVEVCHTIYMTNANVLARAPCSVGILADRGLHHGNLSQSSCSISSVSVLFLGGSDAREALAYADRMTHQPRMSLTFVHFISIENEVDAVRERNLDDDFVKCFKEKHLGNDRVIIKEVVSNCGAETITAIRKMNEGYDLFVMGRGQGINAKLIEGLSIWSENPLLGVIGDFVCSNDFKSSAFVLVLQQQLLRNEEHVDAQRILL